MNAPSKAVEPQLRLTDEQLARFALTIRGLAIDAIEAAKSGHPGAPLGLAEIAAVLFGDVMRYDPTDAAWPGRDRFVLSAGHASMLLYSALHLSGFDCSLEAIKDFRQLHSLTAGHPERGTLPGIETTTGPLGQGLANAVGMALGQRLLAARMNDAGAADDAFDPAGGRVFAVCSDGDLMEGIGAEAAQLAGAWRLGNLVVVYDDNRITIDGDTAHAWREDVGMRFEAAGWRVERVDGNDLPAVRATLERVSGDAAAADAVQPTLVIARTVIGFGSPKKAGREACHGAPLGPDEARATKQKLGLDPDATFAVADDVQEASSSLAATRTAEAAVWRDSFKQWRERRPKAAAVWDAHFKPAALPSDATDRLLASVAKLNEKPGATRKHGGAALQAVAALDPRFVGGSADLSESNQAIIRDSGWLLAGGDLDYAGRNIHYGVREHAGAAIANGLTLHGAFRGYLATFLVFADYCRPSIRLAALMRIPTVFVFTHDSIYVGEDGPTHQPIEQTWALRLIPGLTVVRPADAIETAMAWRMALDHKDGDGPIAMILTRHNVEPLPRPSVDAALAERILAGGYVVKETGPSPADNDGACVRPDVTLIATGSEVNTALGAAKELAETGVCARVVSMPCLSRFLAQPQADRDAVIPPGVPVVTIEAGVTGPWQGLAGPTGLTIGIDTFGLSGPGGKVAAHFGLTPAAIAKKVKAHLA